MNIKDYLTEQASVLALDPTALQLPDADIEVNKIQVVMINEVPPQNSEDWFYSKSDNPNYMKTTLGLFQHAGIAVNSIQDILNMGIYITTAVKSPKTGYTVENSMLQRHLPLLEAELSLFPKLKVIMLMGDVAKKAVNQLVKAQTKRNLIPSESTYKIRGNEYYWKDIRVFPSYIMTGGNILIEKSKCEMISDDIRRMSMLIEE